MTSAYFRSHSFVLLSYFFLFSPSSPFHLFLFSSFSFRYCIFPSSPSSNYYHNTNAARKHATRYVSNISSCRGRNTASSRRRTRLPRLETHSSPPSSPTSRQQQQHHHHILLLLCSLTRNTTLQTQTCTSKKPTRGNPTRHPNPNRTLPPLPGLRLPPPDMSICLL